MDCQGWDPLEHNINKVIDFMEQIKEAEDFDGHKVVDNKKLTKGKGSQKMSNKKKEPSDTDKCCLVLLHQKKDLGV